IASSVTVEKVPTCFFMPVSISSIFSPERRPYSAFQSLFLSWARSEHGIRIRKHTNAALRIFGPLSFYLHLSGIVLTSWASRANRSSVLIFMGFRVIAPVRVQHETLRHRELLGNKGVGRARPCKRNE